MSSLTSLTNVIALNLEGKIPENLLPEFPPGPQGPQGNAITVIIESTNGTIFDPDSISSTTLIARVFQNGVEVTNDYPASQFKWRRVSKLDTSGDYAWNANHVSGFKQIELDSSSAEISATYFCDIVTY